MVPLWPDNDGWLPHGDWVADEVLDAESFLSRLVADQLNLDPEIRGGQMIVTVQNGVVMLEGYADTADTRGGRPAGLGHAGRLRRVPHACGRPAPFAVLIGCRGPAVDTASVGSAGHGGKVGDDRTGRRYRGKTSGNRGRPRRKATPHERTLLTLVARSVVPTA